ncbi:hypothetical protein HD806DRAFT_510002 [Xylariaceae sp. AK1471]|nr:hypothetical protein HD806DRAFT_510002 [Xylariaceae sp. AK1471]
MNISRIDGSRYGAVLFSQPSPAATSITRSRAARVRLSNGCARSIANDFHSSSSRHSRLAKLQWTHKDCPSLSIPRRPFCAAVAPAGGRLPSSNYFTSHPTSVRSWNHTAVQTAEPNERPKQLKQSTIFSPHLVEQPKDEILDFVDQYDDASSVDEHLQFHRDPYLRRYASADGPNLTISDKKEDLELQTIDGDQNGSPLESEPARNLRIAVYVRSRHPAKVNLDTIWELYQALPEPRPTHITARMRHKLMAALASVERKDQKSMLRYFAVVADVKNCGFSLTTYQWNTAMSFASRYVYTTTEVEVEAALQLWRQMEKDARVKANEVTFNILFDAATKAGKFSLAEMIHLEMTRRGFAYNRYHHVSLIHFFGLQKDSSGVRAAYKEMVKAGEVIDTTVLNCVIASFIRCGEEDSAERTYEKMKASNKDLPVIPHRNYTMAKAITKVLMMFARVGKKHPSMRSTFQKPALLSPDLQTYRILITHYGVQLGDLSKVAQFLDEMKLFNVPVHGGIFLALFESFSLHGGLGSDWSAQRLNNVWDAFLGAVDSGADGLYISTWLAMAVLKAHARYATRDEMLDVYECLRIRWELDHTNSEYMLHYLQKLLKQDGLHPTKPRWATTLG